MSRSNKRRTSPSSCCGAGASLPTFPPWCSPSSVLRDAISRVNGKAATAAAFDSRTLLAVETFLRDLFLHFAGSGSGSSASGGASVTNAGASSAPPAPFRSSVKMLLTMSRNPGSIQKILQSAFQGGIPRLPPGVPRDALMTCGMLACARVLRKEAEEAVRDAALRAVPLIRAAVECGLGAGGAAGVAAPPPPAAEADHCADDEGQQHQVPKRARLALGGEGAAAAESTAAAKEAKLVQYAAVMAAARWGELIACLHSSEATEAEASGSVEGEQSAAVEVLARLKEELVKAERREAAAEEEPADAEGEEDEEPAVGAEEEQGDEEADDEGEEAGGGADHQ